MNSFRHLNGFVIMDLKSILTVRQPKPTLAMSM